MVKWNSVSTLLWRTLLKVFPDQHPARRTLLHMYSTVHSTYCTLHAQAYPQDTLLVALSVFCSSSFLPVPPQWSLTMQSFHPHAHPARRRIPSHGCRGSGVTDMGNGVAGSARLPGLHAFPIFPCCFLVAVTLHEGFRWRCAVRGVTKKKKKSQLLPIINCPVTNMS